MMSNNQQHIIGKQVLEVEMHEPHDAFAFRNELGEVYNAKILPGIEKLFDEFDNSLIRVDRLEIDAGEVPQQNWKDDLTERIIIKLREELLKINPVYTTGSNIMSIANNADQSFSSSNGFDNKNSLQFSVDQSVNTGNEKAHSFNEILFYFLKNGRLPWYAGNQMNVQEELQQHLEPGNPLLEQLLVFLKKSGGNELNRLILQFDKDVLNKLLALLLPLPSQSFWSEMLCHKHLLFSFYKKRKPAIFFNVFFYLPAFSWFGNSHNEFGNYYSHHLLKMIQSHDNVSNELTNEFVDMVSNYYSHLNLFISALKNVQLSVQDSFFITNKNEEPRNENEEIYINNAGLVLLHPFLSHLFKAIFLVNEDGNFKDDAAQQKAVLFTQYLVTGETVLEEHQLVLNKILCGYPIDQPVERRLHILPGEMQEAEELLVQVMDQWMMKGIAVNTSIESFRSSFLLRQGKLEAKNEDWKLQVEQRSYDIVLSSLPWNISIIKTNWMKGMLWVEWT